MRPNATTIRYSVVDFSCPTAYFRVSRGTRARAARRANCSSPRLSLAARQSSSWRTQLPVTAAMRGDSSYSFSVRLSFLLKNGFTCPVTMRASKSNTESYRPIVRLGTAARQSTPRRSQVRSERCVELHFLKKQTNCSYYLLLQLWASLAQRHDVAFHGARARAARRTTGSLLIASVVTCGMTKFLMADPISSHSRATISSYSFRSG